ncbi:hypothetical protein ACHAXS_009985 [Conticribra weissflogii]
MIIMVFLSFLLLFGIPTLLNGLVLSPNLSSHLVPLTLRSNPQSQIFARAHELENAPFDESTQHSFDAIIVGSGIGGLSCAALLSHFGYSVAVFESHYMPGGAAHGFSVYNKDIGGMFKFDTGPSFFSGLNSDFPAKSSNPLRAILDILGEEVKCVPYTTFGLKFPEGDFLHSPKFGLSGGVIDAVSGSSGVDQWENLMRAIETLACAVDAMPTAALRSDAGVFLTTAQFLPNFAKTNPIENLKLTSPFSRIIDGAGVTDRFIKNWLDLLCFCLSGVPSDGTITAEMAMMMGEFYDDDAIVDCPIGGAKSIVDALVRGIEKNGGYVYCNSHVEEICIENGQALGIRLKKNPDQLISAKKGVISNISIWDLMNTGIVDTNHFPDSFVSKRKATPECPSFMHLHVGFEMTKHELQRLQAHYIYLDDWASGITDEENCALVSIPSVHDDTLAPDGYAVLHVYTPATERFERWENVKRNSPEYDALKEERSKFLWNVLESIIPDIRKR